MKKIICLFQRNYDGDELVRDEIVPGAEWVIAGDGIATRKFDGTCCMVRAGKLFKRYDAKRGKTPPLEFEPAQDPDPVTLHWPGWVPVGDGPEDRWHREAFDSAEAAAFEDGTYELVGPKIQSNSERMATHCLVRHGAFVLNDDPRCFEDIRQYLATHDIEGIVWHHPDGRMVKIRGRDFGINRKLSWPR